MSVGIIWAAYKECVDKDIICLDWETLIARQIEFRQSPAQGRLKKLPARVAPLPTEERCTTMLDIGSKVNCIGENTLAKYEAKMQPHGYKVRRTLRRHSLNLTGVGTGFLRALTLQHYRWR